MAVTFVLGLYLILSVTGFWTEKANDVVQGGEMCSKYDDNGWYSGNTKWCEFGCCGDYHDGECCGEDVATIVGIVIGCLAGVAAIVTVIVVICCCLRKHRAQQGQVIGGHSNIAATVVTGGSVPMNVYSTSPSGIQYGQPMEYNNATYHQMQAHAPPPMETNWEQPPPSYDQLTRTDCS